MIDLPVRPEAATARAEYDLQLHAVLLRAMSVVLHADRAQRAEDHPAAREVARELAQVEARITELPSARRPMLRLAERLGWGPDEIGFVWAAVALAANPRLLVHARALDDGAGRGLSVALYARIVGLDPAAARALGLVLSAEHSAARHGLLVAGQGAWIQAALPWLPAQDLVRDLAGEPSRHDLLVEGSAPAGGTLLDAAQEAALEQIRAILGGKGRLLLFVEGPELSGRRTALALGSPRPVLILDLVDVGPTVTAVTDALTALRRHAALRGAMPVIVAAEELRSGDESKDGRLRILAQQLELIDGPVALVTTARGLDVGARLPAVRVHWPVPDVATRGRLWRALGRAPAGGDGAGYDQLAVRFDLGAGAIGRAVASAGVLVGDRSDDRILTPTELMAGVRQNIAERMGGLAERVHVKQGWDDLILAEDVLAQIRALVGRITHAHLVYEQWGYRTKMPRGVGVAALFSGPPGTGKTMVAGIIAGEVDLELYQVDLSKIVSKWVGETEKQLARVFDAAEAGHCLLLFDEADALFGQRSSEVRGATDRYANLEVNFLLQRIESFNGTVILTTNLDASLDKALKRRLAAHVVFQHPDDDERARLWEKLLAAEHAPLDRHVDHARLSRMFPHMTGANIRNAALGAAFLAAAERRPSIDQATIVQAARSEYLAMGHILAAPTGL